MDRSELLMGGVVESDEQQQHTSAGLRSAVTSDSTPSTAGSMTLMERLIHNNEVMAENMKNLQEQVSILSKYIPKKRKFGELEPENYE